MKQNNQLVVGFLDFLFVEFLHSEVDSSENRYYAWQRLRREPAALDLFLQWFAFGGWDHFVRHHPLLHDHFRLRNFTVDDFSFFVQPVLVEHWAHRFMPDVSPENLSPRVWYVIGFCLRSLVGPFLGCPDRLPDLSKDSWARELGVLE